jgi:hypothetical protein
MARAVPTLFSPTRARRAGALALAVIALAASVVGRTATPADAASTAAPGNQANPTQAWTATSNDATYPSVNAYPVFPMSSAAVGDVTGDGRPDAVMGGMDSRLRVYDASTGALEVMVALDGPMQASPVLVDLYGKGRPQVMIATASTNPGHSSSVQVLFFTGTSVSSLFRQTSTHPMKSPIYNHMQPFFATPTYGDIDGDGVPEIVAVNLDQHLYAWHLDGSQVFPPKFLYDTLLSSPVVVDWNGDGRGEIVFGADSGPYPPYPSAKGVLWSIDGKGNPSPGYPILLPDQVIWANPTVTDLDGDGDLDVLFGTGMNYSTGGEKVYGYDLRSRKPLPGFPAATAGRTFSTPVVVDLNGDGRLDVLTGTGRGWLYAFDRTGHLLWRQCTTRFSACTENGQTGVNFLQVNPSVADIDGDGRLEVVVSTERDLKVYDAATGDPENFTPSGTRRDAPVTMGHAYANAATPSIAQVDGTAHIYLVGLEQDGDPFQPKPGDNGFLQAWKTSSALGAAPWPTDMGGVNRRGYLPGPIDQPTMLRSFVAATNQDFLLHAATTAEVDRSATALADGVQTRKGFLTGMVNSDAWLDALLSNFYYQTLGRPPDPEGLAYWKSIIRRKKMTVAHVAAQFYASLEYYAGIGGGTDVSWVTNLYEALLGRDPDTSGLAYWVATARSRGRSKVALAFYQSEESSRTRVIALYRSLLGRDPEPAGKDYWTRMLPRTGDLALALLLASSTEYAERAQSRFPNA